MSSRARNTLGLDDDLDPVELRKALERVFGVRFGDTEASACRTVGDIDRMIRGRLSPTHDVIDGCATAMAFYRVRRALPDLGFRSALTPSTHIQNLIRLSARRLLAGLNERSGLRIPSEDRSILTRAGGLMMVGGIVWLLLAGGVASSFGFLAIALAMLGFALIRVDPGRLPDDCRTLGGLARRVAAMNFGALHAQGAKARDRDVWTALLSVLSEHTTLPKADIHAGTLILRKQAKLAR